MPGFTVSPPSASALTDLIQAPARQASALDDAANRPWPLPREPWILAETLTDVLFAHWRVPATALRPLVPEELAIDEFDGTAWLGVTPFEVTNIRVRGTLPIPYVSTFRQVNVRTYVTYREKAGVWFFSLDASSRLAVEAAKRLYRLPFFTARIALERRRRKVVYECVRDERAAFSGAYRAAGDIREATVGSLEHFLTERFCLYVHDGERLRRAELHHRPWLLREAEATIDLNTLPPADIRPGDEAVLHTSERQDLLVWPLRDA